MIFQQNNFNHRAFIVVHSFDGGDSSEIPVDLLQIE